MMMIKVPKSQLQGGFTCACGNRLAPTPDYRLTCPRCNQVYYALPAGHS
jgi:hypothetical protein